MLSTTCLSALRKASCDSASHRYSVSLTALKHTISNAAVSSARSASVTQTRRNKGAVWEDLRVPTGFWKGWMCSYPRRAVDGVANVWKRDYSTSENSPHRRGTMMCRAIIAFLAVCSGCRECQGNDLATSGTSLKSDGASEALHCSCNNRQSKSATAFLRIFSTIEAVRDTKAIIFGYS